MKSMSSFKGLSWLLPLALVLMVMGSSQAVAYDEVPADETQEAASPEEGEADDEAEDAAAAAPEYYEKAELDYTINSLIMLICAVLVLFMQAGFAMVEVGFNASKNAVNILFKNVMDLGIGVILYLFVGWGLMYPGDDFAGKWFGYAGPWVARDTTPDLAYGWSASADFMFQVAFAATAATIVSGAVAGRMKFSGYLCYSAVLTGLVYPISGMWEMGRWSSGVLGLC